MSILILFIVIFIIVIVRINRANIINAISFLGNFIIWYILQNRKSNFISTDKKVLYIPCDPRNVWGSRGDEAMIYSSLKIIEEKKLELECLTIYMNLQKTENSPQRIRVRCAQFHQ